MRLLKSKIIYILLIYVFSLNSKYVTFGLSGRLGDRLVSFSRALYISTKYNIPIKINKFRYWNQLVLSNLPKINARDPFVKFNHQEDNLEELINYCKITTKIYGFLIIQNQL
jgi:hypothetical protein